MKIIFMVELHEAGRVLRDAEYAVVFTGAGVSAESGIPTFRGKGGIWNKYPPSLFGNPVGLLISFLLYPRKLRDFAIETAEVFLKAKPNEGHFAIAEMEKKGIVKGVITQNIDRLHEKAGSKNVVKLHGDVGKWRCLRCGKKEEIGEKGLQQIVSELRRVRGRIGFIRNLSTILPRCACGGRMRPHVVLFMEPLPEDAWNRAVKEAVRCDVMVIVGTSGVVFPAGKIPYMARESGATLVEINPEPSSLTSISHIFLRGSSAEILPALLHYLEEPN